MDTKQSNGLDSHWSGAVIARFDSKGYVDVLGFKYKQQGRDAQIRLPGGSNRHGESYEGTLRRELQDEIAEELKPFDLPDNALHVLFKKKINGDKAKGGGIHTKVFFVIAFEEITCTLRAGHDHFEPDGTVLGDPTWYDAEKIVRLMEEDNTPRIHILAVLQAVRVIAPFRYAELLANHSGREYLAPSD